MVQQIDCAMMEYACKAGLKTTYQYTFDDDAARDSHFSTSPNQLENIDGKQTIAFIGTTNLKYAYWNGPNQPGVYDSQHWVEIPIDGTTAYTDTVYWGDPDVDLSMRARRDQTTGYLIFERRISGAWVEKFKVSDSATVDSMKFIESLTMPVVVDGELGLYGAIVKDSERSNQRELRPIFMDHEHNHYMVVAALPNGRLRVPQNVDAALADPENVPVTYKYAILQGDATKIRDELKSLVGDTRLPASAIDGLPSGVKDTAEEIRDKLKTLLGSARLPATAIAGLPSGSMSGPEIVAALELLQGTERLDATAIKNLPSAVAMTGAEIIAAIENDPSEPKLPALDVANLTGTDYRETDNQLLFDPVNYTYFEIAFTGTGPATFTMPNIINCRDGLQLMMRNLKTDGSIATFLPSNSGQSVNGQSSFTIDPGVSVLFVCMKGRSDWHEIASFEHDHGPVTTGITLDNTTDDIAGVTKINVPTSTIISKGGGEVDLIPHVTLRNMPSGPQDNLAKEIHFQPPLKTFPDPNTQDVGQVYIDPGAYEPQHAPGYLAQLSTNEGIVSRQIGASDEHDGVVWCDVEITPSGEYFDVRRAKKLIGIQDANIDDDPNISGMPTEVMANVGFIGNAPADGFIRCYWMQVNLISGEKTYLLDANGKYIGVERQYKSGDKFEPEVIAGIVEAKALQYIQLHVMHSFNSEVVLLDHTQTYVCIQQQMHGYKTSVAKLEFEKRIGATITPRVEFFGPEEIVLRSYLEADIPTADVPADSGIEELGQFGVHNLTKISAGVSSGILTLKEASDGSIADFDIHQIEDHETCRMARGHTVKYEVQIQDKDDAYRLDLYAWTGEPNGYTNLYNSRNNESLVVNQGWVRVASTFITEDVISGVHSASVSGTIPNNANNFGGFLYPVSAQDPVTLKLKDMTLSYDPAFTGFIESSPELDSERHLEKSVLYRKFVQNTQGLYALRYTLNNVSAGLPMPCGIAGSGGADITVDSTVNQVSGSTANGGEGALKFGADGDVKISTSLQLWNETGVNHTATFWWSEVNADGSTYTKITESEASFTARANTDKIGVRVDMPTFTYFARSGSRIALRGKADVADGAFIECNNNKLPLVETVCQFDEIKPEIITDDNPRATRSELRIVKFSGQSAQNYTFDFKLPAEVEIGSLTAVQFTDTDKTVSIDAAEFSYDDSKEEMTVHIGAAQNGKIYITLWSK